METCSNCKQGCSNSTVKKAGTTKSSYYNIPANFQEYLRLYWDITLKHNF